jgi:hypothetical protein
MLDAVGYSMLPAIFPGARLGVGKAALDDAKVEKLALGTGFRWAVARFVARRSARLVLKIRVNS